MVCFNGAKFIFGSRSAFMNSNMSFLDEVVDLSEDSLGMDSDDESVSGGSDDDAEW